MVSRTDVLIEESTSALVDAKLSNVKGTVELVLRRDQYGTSNTI